MAKRIANKYNKEELKEKIKQDPTPRTTISFYRYVNIAKPDAMRDELYRAWFAMGVLGRIYVAKEGINAQFSVPTAHMDMFRTHLDLFSEFKHMPFKIAVEDDGKSFYKLTIKVRKKIVADGLDDDAFDTTNVGTHLDAESWNDAMADPETVVVDMRNQYESEIGHFEGAVCPDVDTFREELQVVKKELADKKDKKVLLYCTGGIRCEKASAFLKSEGFQDVNQLHGGIIDYHRQIKAQGLENKFRGKNFVFDERLAESISSEVISNCHQCDQPSDSHTNCANRACHLLFIQCDSCRDELDNCCTRECQEVANMPLEEQKKAWAKISQSRDNHLAVYQSRLRPNLKAALEKQSA